MKIYVVTNPELGWDCVVACYTDYSDAIEDYPEEDGYIVHEQELTKKSNETVTITQQTSEMYTQYNVELNTQDEFNSIISFNRDKISVSGGIGRYDFEKLIQMLQFEDYTITYRGKYGYTMEKIK